MHHASSRVFLYGPFFVVDDIELSSLPSFQTRRGIDIECFESPWHKASRHLVRTKVVKNDQL